MNKFLKLHEALKTIAAVPFSMSFHLSPLYVLTCETWRLQQVLLEDKMTVCGQNGQGKEHNEAQQMKRFWGELKRRCLAGTACHQRRQNIMTGMKQVEWIMKPSPSNWSSALWMLPSKVIKGEQSFRLISCLSADRFVRWQTSPDAHPLRHTHIRNHSEVKKDSYISAVKQQNTYQFKTSFTLLQYSVKIIMSSLICVSSWNASCWPSKIFVNC